MIKKTVKFFINILPLSLQNKLKLMISNYYKKQEIKNWERKKWERNSKAVIPPHQIKALEIAHYQKIYNCNILIETGTYQGDMVLAQKDNFEKIFSIELGVELWQNAVKKFSPYKHIEILQGDSGKVLNNLMPKINSKVIFWLDGHYSGGDTVKGEKECPIYEELDAIFSKSKIKHIILVDDARCFNGECDYPTIEALYQYVKSKGSSNYLLEVKDDIIRFTINDQ